MLLESAYRERKWGRFPALRKALEDRCVPDSYYGPTSVSDNIFDALHRLVEIAILANEHIRVVMETAQSIGPEEMYRDLDRLRGDLEAACSFFKQHAEDVMALQSNLRASQSR